jgi:hypothetical protein
MAESLDGPVSLFATGNEKAGELSAAKSIRWWNRWWGTDRR